MARHDEYFGPWAMMPEKLQALIPAWSRADFRRAAVEPPPPSRAQQSGEIAMVPIFGVMAKGAGWFNDCSTIDVRRRIRALAANPSVSGILLAVDSPGGLVAGTDDLAAEVRAARRVKPVYAHVDDLCASAAYWVASQAEMIFANSQTALIGSIGTLVVIYDQSRMAERQGVTPFIFATGPLKGAGVPGAAVDVAQQHYFQGIVDSTQKSFDAAVQKGRHLTDDQLATVRTGQVFLAADAQRHRLIDGVQPIETTMRQLQSRAAPNRAIRA